MNQENSKTKQLPPKPVTAQTTIPVDTVQTQPIVINPATTTQQVQTTGSEQLSFNKKDLAEIIAMAVAAAQSQNIKAQQDFQMDQLARQKDHGNYAAKAGLAAKSFAQRMEQEIKDGKYFEFTFSKHMANTMSGHRNFQVSGYTINLVEGMTTKVPLSLKNDLTLFIEGLDLTRDIPIPKLKGTGGELNANEQRVFDQVTGGVFNS